MRRMQLIFTGRELAFHGKDEEIQAILKMLPSGDETWFNIHTHAGDMIQGFSLDGGFIQIEHLLAGDEHVSVLTQPLDEEQSFQIVKAFLQNPKNAVAGYQWVAEAIDGDQPAQAQLEHDDAGARPLGTFSHFETKKLVPKFEQAGLGFDVSVDQSCSSGCATNFTIVIANEDFARAKEIVKSSLL